MVDLTQEDGVAIMREAVEEASRYIYPRMGWAAEAANAYTSQLSILSSDKVNIDVNYLKPLIKRQAAQNMQALDGERPYIPLGPENQDDPLDRQKAKIYQDAIDDALDRAGYKRNQVTMWFWTLCYGTAFNHLSWESWESRVLRRLPQYDELGGLQGMGEDRYNKQRENVGCEAVPFWQMGFSSAGQTLLTKDWVYRWSLRSIADIERMIDLGRFPSLPKNFDRETLKAKAGSDELSHYQQFNNTLSMGEMTDNDSVGIMHELFSRDRWIVTWNLNIDLDPKNQEPRLYNVDTRTKPFAQMKLASGVNGNQFWGEGLWEQTRDKMYLANLLASMHANHLLKDAIKIKMVDTRAFDEQTLKRVGYGDLIEYDGSSLSGNPPVQVLDQGQPSNSALEFGQWVRERVDDTVVEPPLARGESPSPKQTATGMNVLQQNIAPMLTFETMHAEATYKQELADVAVSVYSSNVSYTDFARSVGFKRAQIAMTPDIHAGLSGGYRAQFEGSDRVGAKAVRFEKFKEFYNFASAYLQGLAQSAMAMGDQATAQLAMQRMEALFRSWESFVEGVPDEERDVIFAEESRQAPGMPPQGEPPAVAEQPPNQMETPVMNRELQNQGI